MIQVQLEQIRQRILQACERGNRDPECVRLIAVSKTKPAEMIREAYEAGQRLFGENHAQELVAKQPLLPPEIEWHFIGNLQRNKVKYLVGKTALIHSVNSLPLAQEIERVAAKREVRQDILLEVNIAGEASKQGISDREARALAEAVSGMPHLRARGLMAVAPIQADPEETRPVFRRLRALREELAPLMDRPEDFCELSMGMSQDFEVAIEEGATYVRVGSAIFGERSYSRP